MKKSVLFGLICPLLLILSTSLMFSCENSPNAKQIITKKDEISKAFIAVNNSFSALDDLSKGTIISAYTGFFMPVGKVVKYEMIFEKTEEGLFRRIVEIYSDEEPKIYEEISDESISDIAYFQHYPKEKIPESTFEKAAKLTILKTKTNTVYQVDWLSEEILISMSPPSYIQHLYSVYTVDNDGYLVEFSTHANRYIKANGEYEASMTEDAITVKLTNYN